ncbi:MAG: membrane integrity-associated transporter subunit PqiC [Cyclobacteriaceae bacterium]|nr:membrane integrity-associated transporter subunit PqiC [Cyclobacteriaceae bacterium]
MMRSILFFILSLFILPGCGSQKVITTKYYVIEIERDSIGERDINRPPVIDQYCEIGQVEVYPAYASTQIANRSDIKELTFYAYHQWAIRPAESFTRIIQDYFDHEPVFKSTSGRFWKIDPAYRIETTVYHMEVIQEHNLFSAHLDVEFLLRETDQGTVVIHHQADETVALAEKDINLLASAVGEIFFRELSRFSDKIIQEIPDVQ